MAHLRRNEHLKLIANAANTVATTVLSIGLLTPIADYVWKGAPSTRFSVGEVFTTCICLAIVSPIWVVSGCSPT